MTIGDKMLKALNDHIGMEFNSAYLYLAMAAQFDHQDLPGFAKWLKVQYQEEVGHAMRMYEYVVDRGGRVVLGPIQQPQADFGTPLDTFKMVLEHERKVTAAIHRLYEQATAEKDYATVMHLQWFINEQVEEEKNAEHVLRQIEATENKAHLLQMLDRHMGAREG